MLAGIEEIVLVVGYKRDRIQTHFGDGDDWDVEIEYAVQDKQLGTGHAILQAEEYMDEGEVFLVLNGDRIIETSLVEELVEESEKADDDVVMSVTRSDEPSEYGVVDMEGNRVVD
ncbi:MAG: sugar phosphate nucleotidyltransferase, partial [Halobacteria archaeon]|nr:sugar phosphate nucleotidyltransferase [Halobacteria archaeon]